MLIKTSELSGAALDWAVAQAEGVAYNAKYLVQTKCDMSGAIQSVTYTSNYRPSTDWAQGGPLLDSRIIGIIHNSRIRPFPFDKGYQAMAGHFIGPSEGHTILIAACRAIVAAKLGDEVEVPDELLSAPL